MNSTEINKAIKEYENILKKLYKPSKQKVLVSYKQINDLDANLQKIRDGILKSIVSKDVNIYGMEQENINALLKGMMQDLYMDATSRAIILDAIDTIDLSFKKLNARLQTRLNRDLNDIVSKGLNKEQIANLLIQNIDVYKHNIRTLTNTIGKGLSRAINVSKDIASGVKVFEYIGSQYPEREFCKLLLGRKFTIQQIQKINEIGNGQGLDVFAYCGGYNCRHQWTPSSPKNHVPNETEFNKIINKIKDINEK